MHEVVFEDIRYAAEEGESVLETLQRHGVEVPNSCRSGVCQSCMLQAVDGDVPERASRPLRPGQREEGYFLPCVCRPDADIEVTRPGDALSEAPAVILSREQLSETVVRVILRLEASVDAPIRAGQFINLQREDGLTRSYSVAGPANPVDELELHIRRVEGGRMSSWLCDNDVTGERVRIRGPAGECVWRPEYRDRPIVLMGVGTGLAPLVGIVRAAIAGGQRERMVLLHGGATPERLYMVDELHRLSGESAVLDYIPCVLDGRGSQIREAPIDEVFLDACPDPSSHLVFVCGDPDLVATLKRCAFLGGAASRDIFSDPFVTADP
ncbi:MAG: 2Fe-2S iron-sulfur cluster-binding protein [Myxococcota bacterium]